MTGQDDMQIVTRLDAQDDIDIDADLADDDDDDVYDDVELVRLRSASPSKPPPEAYLNHTVQANQTCQGPPWVLPVTPVSTGRVQATSKHLTASLRVECVPGTQPHKPVRPTAGRARRNPSTLGSDRAADARAIR